MADGTDSTKALHGNGQLPKWTTLDETLKATELDNVQMRYHLAAGDSADTFGPALARAISTIHAASPNFRSYMADGDVHCIMPGNSFYSREIAGVRFRDWVADLAAGRDVENVQCEDCGVVYGE